MHFKYFAAGLPLAALMLGGCTVNTYSGSAYQGKLQKVTGANYVLHAYQVPTLCVDVSGDKANAGQAVTLSNCHGKENQRFAFVDKGGDASSITTIGGMCLDVQRAATADGTPLDIYPCGNDKPNQTFRHFEDGRIHEVQSHKCLTAAPLAGTPITLAACDRDNQAQVWTLTQ
jgi:hypothetical protein